MSVSAMHGAVPRALPRVSIAATALILFLGLLLGDLGALLHVAPALIAYPYDLDYGEGIVWQQMLNMLQGLGYRPVGVFPAIVYHYPPVYHMSVAATSALLGSDALATGRALSLASAFLSAGLIARLVVDGSGCGGRARWVAGLLGGLAFLTSAPVIFWSFTMRVDLFACALGLAGLVATVRAIDRPRLIWPAALLFVLAIYAKQVSVAAPAAAFLALLVVRPRRAWALLTACLAIGGAALLVLESSTDGGFLRHIVVYNINRNDPSRIQGLFYPIRMHAIYLGAATIGLAGAIRRLRAGWPDREGDRHVGALLMLTVFLLLRTMLLATIMKSGSASNYVLEWFASAMIFTGIAVAPLVERALDRTGGVRPAVAAGLLGLLALQAAFVPRWPTNTPEAAQARAREIGPVVAMIRRSTRPVVSDDMTLLIRAKRPVEWEPSIAAELTAMHLYDEPAFVRLVEAGRFGFFVTDGVRGERTFDSRYDPPVADAMDRTYPVRRVVGPLVLHMPPGRP